jgi:hypothetical protein
MDDIDNFDLLSAEKVAAKYGGDKRKIGEAAQMGLVNPTVAVMAGMFIDRMRNAAVKEQQPTTTVAQDTMTPPVQTAGLGATSQANTQMAAVPTGTRTLAEGGLSSLPVDEDMFPDEYAGGGIVAFARGDLVGQGVNEPFEGESYGAYLMRRAKESLRGPFFSEEGTMPRAGMSESQADFYNQGRTNQALLGDILSGKAPVPVRSADPTLMREATPPGYYADETTRGTARRVAEGGPRRTLDEFGVGATEKREDEEAALKTQVKANEGVNVKAADKAVTDYAKKVREINKEFGVSDEPDAKARAALEKYKEKLNKDLDKAGALGLIQAGLGIAGGKSRYALQNLAGAAPAIEQYSKAMDKIREGEKGIIDSESKLDQAADARARGNVTLALQLEKDAKDLALKERQAAASERQAGKLDTYDKISADLRSGDPKRIASAEKYLGSAKTGQVDERFLRDQWGKMKPLDKMLLERQGIKSFEQWAATQGYPVGGAAGGAGWGIREVK